MVARLVLLVVILFSLVGCGANTESSPAIESSQFLNLVWIRPAEIGVVVDRWSGDLQDPLRTGIHWVNPILNEVTFYPLSQQQYTMAPPQDGPMSPDDGVRARSQDGEEVLIYITILYRVNPVGDNVNTVHRNLQNRYEQDFIRPVARGITRDVIAGYTAEEIWGAMRVQVETDIQDQLTDELATQGLELINVLIREVTFSEAYNAVIETMIYEMRATQTATAAPQPDVTPTP